MNRLRSGLMSRLIGREMGGKLDKRDEVTVGEGLSSGLSDIVKKNNLRIAYKLTLNM